VDRIITIGSLQWRAFWRRFRQGGQPGAGNQAVLLIFAVLLLARYLQALHSAAVDLSKGKTRVFETLLLTIFLVWLFPLAANARNNIAIRKLLHLPLTLKEIFCIKLFSFLIPPYTWLIVLGSLAICYPIVSTPHPLAGILAALLFIAFSALTGMTIAQLLSSGFWRKLLFTLLLLVAGAVVYLLQHNDKERLLELSSTLPNSFVTRAALGPQSLIAVGVLALLAAFALVAAVWSCKTNLQAAPKQRSQKLAMLGWFRIPGPMGGLVAKDFRYFRRLLDPYLGVLVAALGSFYLISAEEPATGLFQVLLLLVVFPSAALAFNFFGLDNRGVMDRLRIMPVTGATILLSKNLAFLMIVGLQSTPLILLASWRLGILAGAIGVAEVVSLAAAYLAWGNWMSLNHPIKVHFFQFSRSNGLIVEVIAGMIFGSLPGMVDVYLLQTGGLAAWWKVFLVLLCSGLVYSVSVLRFAGKFPQREDRIRSAVS
jgi:hypothetical protein